MSNNSVLPELVFELFAYYILGESKRVDTLFLTNSYNNHPLQYIIHNSYNNLITIQFDLKTSFCIVTAWSMEKTKTL